MVVKELRGRMRGWGAAVILTLYLLVVGLLTLLFYAMFRSTNDPSGQQASQIGKFLFSALVIFQVIMVSLLTPAFTAGSITSEKERKTYDVLMITLLRARSVVFGKLGAALAYVLLLILAVAPLESLSFMFGGVSPEEDHPITGSSFLHGVALRLCGYILVEPDEEQRGEQCAHLRHHPGIDDRHSRRLLHRQQHHGCLHL